MKRLMIAIILFLILLSFAWRFVALNKKQFDKKTKKEITAFINNTKITSHKISSYHKIENFPNLLQRYLKNVLPESTTSVQFVKMTHQGTFRTKSDQRWLPIEGIQYYRTGNPGFIWRAKLRLSPFAWIEARDYYANGKGNMLVKLLSTIVLANAKGPEMDASSLLRFLSEIPLFPAAFVTSDYLIWDEIDDTSAQVTLKNGNLIVTGIFYFNEIGEITRFETYDRYRAVGKNFVNEKWTIHYRNYREKQGVLIPTEAEAVWNLESGDFSYAKFLITDVEFNKPQELENRK